jgi:hypothetical protein
MRHMNNPREDFIRTMAEQSYMFQLLVRQLQTAGILQPGQPQAAWQREEFEKFLSDFRGNYFPGVL